MSARVFIESSERYGSKFRKVVRVQCRKCGVSHSVGLATPGGFLPHFAVTKKLEKAGWLIGPDEHSDYCPDHSHPIKEKKPPMLKVVEQEKPSPSEAPPREMTRDDRRIIISKLDAVYLDSKRGYDAGWSDHKVASDLGVPRKWVEDIRAENFGDVGTNEDMAEFYEQAKALASEARKALADARDYYEKIDALMQAAKTDKALAQIADRLGKVEKLAEAVRKYVVT